MAGETLCSERPCWACESTPSTAEPQTFVLVKSGVMAATTVSGKGEPSRCMPAAVTLTVQVEPVSLDVKSTAATPGPTSDRTRVGAIAPVPDAKGKSKWTDAKGRSVKVFPKESLPSIYKRAVLLAAVSVWSTCKLVTIDQYLPARKSQSTST
jgi:hypothetical protein